MSDGIEHNATMNVVWT